MPGAVSSIRGCGGTAGALGQVSWRVSRNPREGKFCAMLVSEERVPEEQGQRSRGRVLARMNREFPMPGGRDKGKVGEDKARGLLAQALWGQNFARG